MHALQKTSYRVVAALLASGAAIAATPAAAQVDSPVGNAPEMTYEERSVFQSAVPDYAEPAFVSDPVVQDVEVESVRREIRHPAQYTHHSHHTLRPMDHSAGYPVQHGSYPGRAMGAPVYFPQDGYPAGAVPYPGEFEHAKVGFDRFERDEWLEECRVRYDGRDGRGKQRGGFLGGLFGAAAGGLIGNRIAGRGDRLGGTLLGAGLGGVAGAVAGSAIGEGSDQRDRRSSLDECEIYLDQYEAQWRQMRYGYGPVMLVPIMVPVEQRAVVREYVTEEWVEEEVMVKVPGKRVIYHKPAPKPVKTVPIKTVPVKSVKSVKGS